MNEAYRPNFKDTRILKRVNGVLKFCLNSLDKPVSASEVRAVFGPRSSELTKYLLSNLLIVKRTHNRDKNPLYSINSRGFEQLSESLEFETSTVMSRWITWRDKHEQLIRSHPDGITTCILGQLNDIDHKLRHTLFEDHFAIVRKHHNHQIISEEGAVVHLNYPTLITLREWYKRDVELIKSISKIENKLVSRLDVHYFKPETIIKF